MPDTSFTRRDVAWCVFWSLVLIIMSASMSPWIVPVSIAWLSFWYWTVLYGERLQRESERIAARLDAVCDDQLRGRMADILTRTANALKGEPESIYSHDWSDLPDVAARLRSELADRRRGLAVGPRVNIHTSCQPGECGVCSPPPTEFGAGICSEPDCKVCG